MAETNGKNILNLVEGLNDFLANYLEESGFKVFLRHEVSDIEVLNYIITHSVEEAKAVSKEYDTNKNEIKIICFDSSKEIKDFLLSNGRLIINENFNDDFISRHILDKFFSQKLNIHLDETFDEKIENVKDFKVTNHLTTGVMIDELSVHAFDEGFNLVPLRSFIDHTIYYFTYLKQAGLAGVPFEFEYGNNEDVFILNVHASVKNFVAEYMIDSFGTVNSNDPLNYLLGVVLRSCDFLDITYVEDPGRVVLTGYFSKNSDGKLKGVSFNNVLTTAQVMSQVEKRVENFIPQSEKNKQLSDKQNNLQGKNLPGGILDIITPPGDGSILNERAELTEELVAFMVNSFEQSYPDTEISDFNQENFDEFVQKFKDLEFTENLSDSDHKHLVERIQKNNLAKAYTNEIAKVRDELKDDEGLMQTLQDTMGNDVADNIADHIDASILNNILSKENIPEQIKGAVPVGSTFGDFEPSVPVFSTSDAFADISPNFDEGNPFDADAALTDLNDNLLSPQLGNQDPFGDLDSISFGESVPDFGADNFDDLLPGDPANFPMANFDSSIPSFSNGDTSTVVPGFGIDEDDIESLLGGGPDGPEAITLVKGGPEEADDFMQKISGMDSDPESDFAKAFSNSGNDDDDNFVFKIGNSAERKKELRLFVKSTLEDSPGLQGLDMKVKAFVHKEAPQRINAGLERYAQKLGKTLDDLTDEQLADFSNKELPNIMSDLMVSDEKISEFKKELEDSLMEHINVESSASEDGNFSLEKMSNFENKFKNNLENKLSGVEDLEKIDDKFVINSNNLPEEKMQEIIRSTMKDTFDDEFKFSSASPEEIEAKENQLIKDLSQTLQMKEEDVKRIVKGASNKAKEHEKQVVTDKLFGEGDDSTTFSSDGNIQDDLEYKQKTNSKVEAELITKLKSIEDENKHLKTSMSVMQLKLSTTEDVKQKFEEVLNDSAASDDDILRIKDQSSLSTFDLNEEEKRQIVTSLKEGSAVPEDTAIKLQKSLEKENQIIELAKRAETALKKAHLEAGKKDALFKTELERAQKAMKAKEIVLNKAKESMKNVMDKKEVDLQGYKKQVNELNQKLQNDQSTKLKTEVKGLKREKESLSRTADVYKGKLESMAKSIESHKKEDNSASINEENRGLQRVKTQLENRLNVETKAKRSLEDRYQKAKQLETKLKTEVVNTKSALKSTEGQIKLLKDQNTKLVQTASAVANTKSDKVTKELSLVKGKNIKLQEMLTNLNTKLAEVSKSAKTSVAEPAKLSVIEPSNDNQSDETSSKEAEMLKTQNESLQLKIKELVQKLKKVDSAAPSAPVESGSAKEKRLEQSVKKMNMELTKTRTEAAEKKKEAMKAKTEVNGLKNQLAKMKKDLEKATKLASAAKGKKKAA